MSHQKIGLNKMNFYRLLQLDDDKTNFVLFKDPMKDKRKKKPRRKDGSVYLQARQTYEALQCGVCWKIDEEQAFQLPIEEDVRMSSRRNFIGTEDNQICMDRRMMQSLVDGNVTGLRYLFLPADERFVLVLPEVFVPTDRVIAGFKYDGPECPECGRHEGVYIQPSLASMTLPDDPDVVFSSDVWLENRLGRSTLLMAGEKTIALLKKNKITGIFFDPVV